MGLGSYGPFEVGVLSLMVLNFMWLKFTAIWRFFRLWALASGVEYYVAARPLLVKYGDEGAFVGIKRESDAVAAQRLPSRAGGCISCVSKARPALRSPTASGGEDFLKRELPIRRAREASDVVTKIFVR